MPIKDKYLLTIWEAGAYFCLGTKLLGRMAEENAGGFAIMIGNRYMIIRSRFEKYILEINGKQEMDWCGELYCKCCT